MTICLLHVLGGTELTIGGFGFTPDVVVQLGGANCDILTRSESQIICKTPRAVSALFINFVYLIFQSFMKYAVRYI